MFDDCADECVHHLRNGDTGGEDVGRVRGGCGQSEGTSLEDVGICSLRNSPKHAFLL